IVISSFLFSFFASWLVSCGPPLLFIQTFVTMNIPEGHPVGSLSVGLYSIAIMMSYPLQLFPAVKCL
ncbi:unnamed protein product, partial [Hapterophycus canaliculatus]